MAIRMFDCIQKKKAGKELSLEEIEFFINGYLDGTVPDYQVSALIMAICFNGMTNEETKGLTYTMAFSGDMIDLSEFGNLTCDKHSTGGVGDKTSLIVAPIVSVLGGKLAKMSGRGLGHTGGTIDKLESIPGYKTVLPREEFIRQTHKIGISLISQSGNICPADKKLYALRDVTATVDSIPLIVSSIMSKKIAAGSKNIVLDVKVGSGAFMKTYEDARILAENMVEIGKVCERNVAAVITDMNTPLGKNIGNSLEVIEAVEVLKGNVDNDLGKVSVVLAAELLKLFKNISVDDAIKEALKVIYDGSAYRKFEEWIAAQGGDISVIRDTSKFQESKYSKNIISTFNGYISQMDSEIIGNASVLLGAGRAKLGDEIDYSAGIVLHKKTGDRVKKGDILCTLYANDDSRLEPASAKYLSSLTFSSRPPKKTPLIHGIVR